MGWEYSPLPLLLSNTGDHKTPSMQPCTQIASKCHDKISTGEEYKVNYFFKYSHKNPGERMFFLKQKKPTLEEDC